MDYDLRQLRYFVTIADAGSFSKASLQLGVAQSALSHHISQMEARLGVALFSRSSKGVEQTESGARFLDHAGAILAAVDAATNDVRDNSKEPGGLVRLGATLTIAPMLIEPLMARLSETAPRVSLRIEERLSPQLVQAVASGELDVAVCFNAGDDRRIDEEHDRQLGDLERGQRSGRSLCHFTVEALNQRDLAVVQLPVGSRYGEHAPRNQLALSFGQRDLGEKVHLAS